MNVVSEKKKKQVIHVKDLVIKADNVYIDRDKRDRERHRRPDPFFGFSRRGDDVAGREEERKHRDDEERDKN